jgi:uncharacterized protein (TIGR02001 family)
MKLSKISTAALLTLMVTGAFAQAKAPEPDYTLSYNVGAFTDYRYRGLSQSRLKPAVQGGLDFAHKNGFYLGAWGSTISWIKDDGRKASAAAGTTIDSGNTALEIDLYGGYKGSISKDLGFDVGILQYVYPGNKYKNLTDANANTTEVYGALTYGPVTAKYSHSTSNLFGFKDSKGSGYLDLTANFDLGSGYTLTPHIGHQRVKGWSDYSYTDYSVTVAKDLGNGLVVSGAIVGANSGKDSSGTPWYGAPDSTGALSTTSKDNGRAGLVLGLKYNF